MGELRYALRGIKRQPLFTVIVVTMLTLGVGGATAMFSVVRGVLLKPLPYDHADELVWMYGAFKLADAAAVSPPDFLDYRARNQVFQSLGAMVIGPSAVTVARAGGPERLNAASVSAGLITTLGVRPILGRDFRAGEERKAGGAPIIISERLWHEQFQGSREVLGTTLRVDQTVRTVVGVMPERYALPFDSFIRLTDPVDLYVPIAFDEAETQVRRFHFLRLIGRLKPGVAMLEAQSQMDAIARQLAAAYPENETWKLRQVPLHERIVGDMRRVLSVLMGAVLLLLLVACVNVAGLLLARGVLRRPEIFVRVALGASRGRVVAQLLTEALTLACLGAVGGLVVAFWIVQAVKRLGPLDLPRLPDVTVDFLVVVFAGSLSILAALLFAAAPAIFAAHQDSASFLREGSRAIAGRSRSRVRQTLVIAQVASACTLVAVAGLFVQSLWRLQAVETGFSTRDVVLTHISLPQDSFDSDQKLAVWYQSLLERLSSTAGIEAAGLASAPPLVGAGDTAVHPQGEPPLSDKDRRFAQLRYVDGDYFFALEMPIVAGRALSPTDRVGTPPVVVISRRMADQFFPHENPIGQYLVIDRGEMTTAEIVGVVGDARLFGQAQEPPATMYLSSRQLPRGATHLVVRMNNLSEAGAVLRAIVRSHDETVAIGRVQFLQSLLDDSLAQPRFRTMLIALFAGVALMLTLGGLYGTVSWVVSQRTREFGIRSALGARPGELLVTVLSEGFRLVLVGTVLGLTGGLVAARLLRDLLFEERGSDPAVMVAVTLGLATLGLAAMIGPALRAGRTDPAVVLRSE
jgi:putative ABC transport system permease protein